MKENYLQNKLSRYRALYSHKYFKDFTNNPIQNEIGRVFNQNQKNIDSLGTLIFVSKNDKVILYVRYRVIIYCKTFFTIKLNIVSIIFTPVVLIQL